MGYVTIGLSAIEIGDIESDGGIADTWAAIGDTAEGTAVFATEDGTTTEIRAEEKSSPIHIINTPGKKTFSFSLASPDVTQLQKVFGGTVTGTGDTAVWKYPASQVAIEKSLKITPEAGLVISCARVSMFAKFDGGFTKNDSLKVNIVATVLTPEKAGEPEISAVKKAA